MKTIKKVIAAIPKCYAICLLDVPGERSFLVAAEGEGDCIRFDLEGNPLETIWSKPGGVMNMVQIPGSNGSFLATNRFYSPNNSRSAEIILAEPVRSDGTPVHSLLEPHHWNIRKIIDLPFVHRFDIMTVNNTNYLIACTVKSDHEYENDWSHPGRVYTGILPDDLSSFDMNNQLTLNVLKDGLTKNHGYCRCVLADGRKGCFVTAEEGLFQIAPPVEPTEKWSVEQLINVPISDATEIDLDEDGIKELVTYSPFHGSELTVWKPRNGVYKDIYRHPFPLEHLHAIWSGQLNNTPIALVGHRKGNRDLFALSYDHNIGSYSMKPIDCDRGPTNVQVYDYCGHPVIIAANRETDEVALYFHG